MIKEEDHNAQFSDVIAAEELGDREAPTANVRISFSRFAIFIFV